MTFFSSGSYGWISFCSGGTRGNANAASSSSSCSKPVCNAVCHCHSCVSAVQYIDSKGNGTNTSAAVHGGCGASQYYVKEIEFTSPDPHLELNFERTSSKWIEIVKLTQGMQSSWLVLHVVQTYKRIKNSRMYPCSCQDRSDFLSTHPQEFLL